MTGGVRVELSIDRSDECPLAAMTGAGETSHSLSKSTGDRGGGETVTEEFAWSEDPPSRTRHHVSNVRVTEVDGDEIDIKNNLLLYRGQGEDTSGTVLSAERHDTLRRVDGELKLARRDIRLDHTVLPMKNISVFF